MSEESERTSTGIVGFDTLLQGGYPKGRVLLEGPSSEERNDFAFSFAADGLKKKDCVVIVTSSVSPTKVRKTLRKLGVDTKQVERNGHLVIVDWYSHTTSAVVEIEEIGAVIKCPGDILHLSEAFGKAVSKLSKKGDRRAVIDGLSSVIGNYNLDSALLLSNSMNSVLGKGKSTILFVVDSEMHDTSTISALEEGFDGLMKLRRIKGEGAVVGELSIRAMKDIKVPAESVLIEKTADDTLRIGSEAPPETEEIDEDLSNLMESLQKDSENEVTWFELGMQYASEGDHEKALECLDMAIKLRPNYLAAWTSKANIYIEQGKQDDAIQCYRKVLDAHSESEESPDESSEGKRGAMICPECGTEIGAGDPFCLGCGMDIPSESLTPTGKPVEEVLADCEERIRKNPKDADAWFVKGLCLARMGRYQESIDCLNQTTRLNIEYPGLWFIKGKLYAKLGDEKKATLSIKRAIELARKDIDERVEVFECSICGKSVGISADRCSNCGARFKAEHREELPKEAEEEEEELVPFPETVSLDGVLKRWEAELADLISEDEDAELAALESEEEETAFVAPKPRRRVKKVKKEVPRKRVGLTNGLIREEREAKRTRGLGLTNGTGRTNGLTNGLVNGTRRKREGRVNGVRGRTNGLTNGVRGRTNGLTNGVRGRTNGLTNGVRGRTNGLTNGVRGRTNGLTNGVRGRTNGLTNGLTNGVRGRTNGLTNGVRPDETGLTNGLTNGLGRATGLTNGLVNGIKDLRFSLADGLTNGNGLTNGFGVRRFSREVRLARWKVFLIPLFAFVLLAAPLFYIAAPPQEGVVTIDGQFNDWDRLLVTQMNPSAVDPNVDILRASVAMSPSTTFFYLEVSGSILQGNPSQEVGDVIQILIDSDREYETGYQLRGLGADYLVEITGMNGGVHSSNVMRYESDGNQYNWNSWTVAGGVRAAVRADGMEMSVGTRMFGQDVDSVLVLFHTLSWTGDEDFSDYVLSEGGGVLSARQRSAITSDVLTGSDQNILNMELTAYNKQVTLSSLQLEITGSVQVAEINTVKLVDEGDNLLDQVVFLGNPLSFEFDPLVIGEGSTTSLTLRADLSGVGGHTIGAIIPSTSSLEVGEDAATVSYISSIRDLGYVGAVPQETTVDAGFLDWLNCSNVDEQGEGSLNGDMDIDIMCFDERMDQGSLFAYFDVSGRILAGTDVPSRSPSIRQQTPSYVVDSDKDTVPDQYDTYPYDFNNDGVSDALSQGDVDDDGLIDYPLGTDHWLNATIPASFPPPYAGRNVTRYIGPVEKPVIIGEDVARIYIDADNYSLTGYSYGDIGAEYVLEVRGIEGKTTYAGLSEFVGSYPGEWKWSQSSALVDVALDSRRLETSADVSSLQLQADYVLKFETGNWRGGSDSTDRPAGRGLPVQGTRHFADANGGYGLVAPDGDMIDITIDGTIDEASETDWTTTAKTDTYNPHIKTYVVYNSTDLFVAIEVLAQTSGNGAANDIAEIAFDTNHGGGTKPQTDDYMFKMEGSTGTPALNDYNGDGNAWDNTWESSSWTADADDTDTYVTYEFRIPLEYVFGTSSPSGGDIGGFCVHIYNSTGDVYYYWPDATGSGSNNGRQVTPDDWGDLFHKRPRFVINEVSPLTSPEYVELYNDGGSIDINGIVLSDQDGFTWTRSSSLVVPNSVYLVLMGGSGTDDTDFSDWNGTLYIGTTEFTDAGDDVLLKYGGNDMGFDFMQYGSGGDVQSCPSDSASENSWSGTLSAPTGSDSAGRDKDSSDINDATDWDNTGGPDVDQRTRGYVNYLTSLSVSGEDKAPANVYQGQTDVDMLRLNLSTSYGWIEVTGLDMNRTGTSSTESDISEATLWIDEDGDGDFDSGTDSYLATGSYSGGNYTFSGFSFFASKNCAVDLFVVYNISSSSNTGVTVGARIDGSSNVTVSSPNSVASFSPIQSTNCTINANELQVYGGDVAPSVAFKSEDLVEILNLTLSTDYGSVTVTQIDVTLTGNGTQSDIDSADLYEDVNGDGDFDEGTDIHLATGTYSSGVYSFSSLSIVVSEGSDKELLVIYNISATATLEHRVGAKINDENDMTVQSPDTVGSFSSISSSNVPIRYSDIFVIEVTGEVYESTDGGKTFTNPGDAGADFVAICANRTNSDIYAFVDDGSVYLSTDKGQTWTLRGDAFGGATNGIDMTIDNNDDIYLLRLSGVVYSSTDGGASFSTLGDSGGSSKGIEANYSNNDLYVVEADGDIQYSSDGGNTWASRGYASSDNDVEDIVIDTAGYIYVLEGSGEVYRSTDYGSTFSQLSDIGDSTYVGITIDYSYNYIYVVASDGSVHLSTNRGSNWMLRSDIGSETDYQDITCIIIPEFDVLVFPVILAIAIPLLLVHRRKAKRKETSQG